MYGHGYQRGGPRGHRKHGRRAAMSGRGTDQGPTGAVPAAGDPPANGVAREAGAAGGGGAWRGATSAPRCSSCSTTSRTPAIA